MKTLYEDKTIVLEQYDDEKKYRITMFRDDNHWHGELIFDETGIINDDLTE